MITSTSEASKPKEPREIRDETRVTSIRLAESLWEKVSLLAVLRRSSLSEIVSAAIREFLDAAPEKDRLASVNGSDLETISE